MFFLFWRRFMLKMFTSAPALALASAAALSLTATPAMARHWHRDRGIDGGDVLAGVLILGGIAAIASAAGKANRDGRDGRDYRSERDDYRYPQSRYPDTRYPENRDWRERGTDHSAPRGTNSAGRADWRGAGNIDGAVEACVGEVERGSNRVDTVEGVNRDTDGWRVGGKLSDGRAFSCTADGEGRVRRATVDGRALI
jgi:hypothetical protein